MLEDVDKSHAGLCERLVADWACWRLFKGFLCTSDACRPKMYILYTHHTEIVRP